MSNALSPALLAQLFAPQSNDPYLTLVTLSHSSFAADICLVNNSEDIVSRGITYSRFPMRIKLPVDDGESGREVTIEFDNVSLELIDELRTVTDSIGVKLELILASIPDDVQSSIEELKIQVINYSRTKISARLILDNFLNTEVTSEIYSPSNFPGIF